MESNNEIEKEAKSLVESFENAIPKRIVMNDTECGLFKDTHHAKQCALIAVGIRLSSTSWQSVDYVGEDKDIEQTEEFWLGVKSAIEKL